MDRAEFEKTLLLSVASQVPSTGGTVILRGWKRTVEKDRSETFNLQTRLFDIDNEEALIKALPGMVRGLSDIRELLLFRRLSK